jgi:hypothetical protein
MRCYKMQPKQADGEQQFGRRQQFAGLTPSQQKFLSDLLGQMHCEMTDGATPMTISYQDGQPIISGLVAARRKKATGQSYSLPDGVVQLSNPSKGQPKERTSTRFAPPLPDCPAGHYAIPGVMVGYDKNDLYFYRVNRPAEGRWAGRTFLDAVIGGHPNESIRDQKVVRRVLQAILDLGPEEAGILYGNELGRCSRCNRHLTDELSRTLGMGPECRSR